jgi:hypothetical protein
MPSFDCVALSSSHFNTCNNAHNLYRSNLIFSDQERVLMHCLCTCPFTDCTSTATKDSDLGKKCSTTNNKHAFWGRWEAGLLEEHTSRKHCTSCSHTYTHTTYCCIMHAMFVHCTVLSTCILSKCTLSACTCTQRTSTQYTCTSTSTRRYLQEAWADVYVGRV